MAADNETAEREIVISRVLDAPRDLVWEAMTDPAQVANWWGPRGFTTTPRRLETGDARSGRRRLSQQEHIHRGQEARAHRLFARRRQKGRPRRAICRDMNP